MKKFPTEGILQEISLYRLLAEISANKLSGVITVSGEADTVDIYLSEGNCVRVDSHYPREDLLLGQLLIVRGYCSEAQIDELLQKQKNTMLLLGKLAFEAGYINDKNLSRLLEDQILLALFPCLSWTSGVFYFQLQESIPHADNCFRPVDLKIIYRIAPKILKGWNWMKERIPDPGIIPARSSGVTVVSEGVQIEHSSDKNSPKVLTRSQEKTFDLIDGKRSVREICDSIHLFEWFTLMSLIDLQDAGIITIPKSAPKKKAKKADKSDRDRVSVAKRINVKSYLPTVLKVFAGLAILVGCIYAVKLVPWQKLQKTEEVVLKKPIFQSMSDTIQFADEIRFALAVYHLFNNTYPENLGVLVDESLIHEDSIFDGWNVTFQYEKFDDRYELTSLGADTRTGTADDLKMRGQVNDYIFGCYFPAISFNSDIGKMAAEGDKR